jgi:hypothetical protein
VVRRGIRSCESRILQPMKLRGQVTVGGLRYTNGDEVPWTKIYPFFLVHMLVFGTSGFLMAYAAVKPDIGFLYLHGGGAITIYVLFYLRIFGADEVKWMFVNAGLGMAGIYSQIAWILERMGKDIGDVRWYVHVVPFLYYVLYVFLIRQAFLDLFRAREDPARRARADAAYVVVSLVVCAVFYLLP